MDFYERLNSLIKSKGLSQRKVEMDLGFSNGSIGKWKKYSPNAEKVQLLAQYFGVTVDWIMTGEETKEGYYLNEDTAKLAQEMFEDEDMRSLFDMKRNMPPERFKAHMEFMKNLYDQEKGNSNI